MSISIEQRKEELLMELEEGVKIVKARSKHDRRVKVLVVQDGDQILREYWPIDKDVPPRAREFAAGYIFAKRVWKAVGDGFGIGEHVHGDFKERSQ